MTAKEATWCFHFRKYH